MHSAFCIFTYLFFLGIRAITTRMIATTTITAMIAPRMLPPSSSSIPVSVPSGDVVVEGRVVVVAGRVVVGVSLVIEGVGVRVLSSGVRTSESTFPPSGRGSAEVPSSPGMMSLFFDISYIV